MTSPDLSALAHALIDTALRVGADAADALVIEGTALGIDTRQGSLEQAERAEGIDLGLRVLIGQRQACVSASDTSKATIDELARRTIAMAREAPEDASAGLAVTRQLSTVRDAAGLELADPAPEPEAAELERAALALEEAARTRSGIRQVEASASYSHRRLCIVQSNGFEGGYERTSHARSIIAFCGEGAAMERDHAFESRIFAADLPLLTKIGEQAAERALARVGAVKPPTGRYPVLFDERVAGSLIGHLLSAINGEAIARGASWARDLMGKPVLPAGMSVSEDPLRPRAPASCPFDAEGLPVARRDFVLDGVLQAWVLDLATARRLGLQSTANARRGTSAPPLPGTTNIDLTPGRQSRDDLIRSLGRGLLVTSLIGATINPNNGDYSRGAAGMWIEGGAISHPVHECTIAGNLRDMLLEIAAANDAQPHLSVRVPSILVQEMTIAGA